MYKSFCNKLYYGYTKILLRNRLWVRVKVFILKVNYLVFDLLISTFIFCETRNLFLDKLNKLTSFRTKYANIETAVDIH